MKFLDQVQQSLGAVNGYELPFSIADFLVPSKSTDQLIIKEGETDAELLVCLRESLLTSFSDKNFPADFQLQLLPDLSVVIEELSHFNTYCLSAAQDREISEVELEVQGEVDKFGVALDFLHQRNEESLKEKVFEVLFQNCKLGEWVKPEDEQRYYDAHQIARNFCRSVLEEGLNFEQSRSKFRAFFKSSREVKLSSKY
ncbi:MAG: hypothetical protein JWQ35_793 [Bacteriovoracaceae bacterium]|nr:hypothetical protein [Bacteriovoracaceae bacterium]